MDDLSPEEQRLREYLEDEDAQGGWPEALPREHPDVFPVHPKKRQETTKRRSVRYLLYVTVPTVAILLVAEATGTLMGSPWLLALLVVGASFSFYHGFLNRDPLLPYFEDMAQASFVGLLICIGIAGYFGIRQHHTVPELASIIDPVPEITSVTYVPTGEEMAAVEAMIRATSGMTGAVDPGAAPLPSANGTTRFWLFKTALTLERATAFYQEADHRRDWELRAGGDGVFVLSRGEERLTVVVSDDWPRPWTVVAYIYAPSP